MHFHLLAFDGPDDYARAGGIATRITGLVKALADDGFDTHLWFIGDPDRPGHEQDDQLSLHRWCQWISRYPPLAFTTARLIFSRPCSRTRCASLSERMGIKPRHGARLSHPPKSNYGISCTLWRPIGSRAVAKPTSTLRGLTPSRSTKRACEPW